MEIYNKMIQLKCKLNSLIIYSTFHNEIMLIPLAVLIKLIVTVNDSGKNSCYIKYLRK